MKTLFLSILLIFTISVSQAQTTTAQDALKAFMDARKTSTIAWSSLTNTQKQNYILQREGLEIAAEMEIEANRVIAENQAASDAATRRQQIITYLTNHGFACDNGKADWDKLYNHPKYFGDKWYLTADYQRSISPNVDYFISVAYDIWLTYMKNGD